MRKKVFLKAAAALILALCLAACSAAGQGSGAGDSANAEGAVSSPESGETVQENADSTGGQEISDQAEQDVSDTGTQDSSGQQSRENGSEGSEQGVQGGQSEQEKGEKDSVSRWDPVIIQRQVILDSGAMAGVIFLGYIDADAPSYADDAEYYQKIFAELGYTEDYPFLKELPADHFVSTENGAELYLVIPLNPDDHVRVNGLFYTEENAAFGGRGPCYYENTDGAPVLIKCNRGELTPSVIVTIEDARGEVLEWRPMHNIQGGRVETTTDRNSVYDLTIYPEGWKRKQF